MEEDLSKLRIHGLDVLTYLAVLTECRINLLAKALGPWSATSSKRQVTDTGRNDLGIDLLGQRRAPYFLSLQSSRGLAPKMRIYQHHAVNLVAKFVNLR
uniref:Uncharacterized protein n=1 Tax=uncultured marine virus TaxID=186617 RepID=A0A0F7L4Z7_9VIRU|nr:hypothetical protein [uncultured marine virus]